MQLEGNKVIVNKSAAQVCAFLTDVVNFEQLMPENTSKFEIIREDAFLFALKGMPEIALEIKEIHAPNKVILGAISDKLPFTLTATIEEIDNTSSSVQLHFEGQFNAMMGMMIKGPISKFLETLSANLEKIES